MKCEICDSDPCKCEKIEEQDYELFKEKFENQFTKRFEELRQKEQSNTNQNVNDYRRD